MSAPAIPKEALLSQHESQIVEHKSDGTSRDPEPARGIGRTLAILAVLLVAALGIGFLLVQHHRTSERDELSAQAASDADAAPIVEVIPVENAPPTQSIQLPGDTRGWYQSTIYARVDGYVAQWFSDIGDRGKNGQVLAKIDTPELDQQLIAAQEKLAVSQAEVKVMQANAEFAKETYERWRDSPKGVVSDQEREEKQADYNSSIARQNAANAQVNADKADVGRLMALEDFKNVTAPYDGVITQRRIDIGDLVTSGSTSSTTLLYTMAQTSKIRVFVDVPQRIAGSLDFNAAATAVSNVFPDTTFKGKIARTSDSIDPGSRTLRVEVDVANPDLMLMPGMYAEVTLPLMHKSLMQVPASAMIFRSSGPQVAVVDDDGKINFRSVQISVDNGNDVELASGVSAGDKVALNLSSEISDGEHVTVRDDQPKAPSVAAAAATQPSSSASGSGGASLISAATEGR
jgi:RND family efflux transporter MFP subunit